jgi:hypothetical protein
MCLAACCDSMNLSFSLGSLWLNWVFDSDICGLAFAAFWWMNIFFLNAVMNEYTVVCVRLEHFPGWFRWFVNWHPVLSERDFLSVCFLGICIKATLSMLSYCLLKCWEEFCLWIKYAMGIGRPFPSGWLLALQWGAEGVAAYKLLGLWSGKLQLLVCVVKTYIVFCNWRWFFPMVE